MLEPQSILTAITLVTVVIGGFFVVRSRVSKDALDSYESLTKAQDERLKLLETDVRSLQDHNSKLENEINVVKTLPLAQLAQDYHKSSDTLNLMAEHLSTVNKILDTQGSMIKYIYEQGTKKPISGNGQQ